MKMLITSLFVLLYCKVTIAQSTLGKQVNDAKFQMVKKTAEFLSTDKATFGNSAKNKCDGCTTYDDVKKYAADNKLMKVNELIDDWQKIKVDTTLNSFNTSLSSFEHVIIAKITTGGDNKIARIKLPAYQNYMSSLNALISNIKTTKSEAAASVSPDENAAIQKPESTVIKPGDTSKKITASPQVVPDEETVPETSLADKAISWLPYIIAVISLFLLLTVWRYGNENKKKLTILEKDKKDADKELSKQKKDNAGLLLKIKALEDEVKNKEIDLQATEARLLNAENNNKKAVQSNVPEQPAIEKPQSRITVQKPKPVVATLKYARYADLGDGFSNAGLLDNADDETIFELIITPNNSSGEFKVTGQRAAQHYALSNAQYFLGKTCQYNSFPSENATIQTEEPGAIRLNGNKWTIVSPAKISFS